MIRGLRRVYGKTILKVRVKRIMNDIPLLNMDIVLKDIF